MDTPHTSAAFDVLDLAALGKDGSWDGREDAALVTEHHAFVLDGVGSYPSFDVAGRPPGRLARDLACEVLHGLPREASLREAVDAVTSRIADELAVLGIDERDLPRPPAIQLVGYSAHHRQAWRVGDASIRIGGVEHLRDQRFDLLCNGMRTMLRHAQLLDGESREQVLDRDPMATFLEQLVTAQSRLLNADVDSPYAFGWVTARPCPDRFLETFEVPPGTEVALATDGHIGVAANLAEAERRLAAELARAPLSDLARAIDRDEIGEQRSFDDRAYLRLRTAH